MNTKTKTYVLLGGVLLIWGIVGFKIMSVIDPNPNFNKNSEHNIFFSPLKINVIDTFSIQEVEIDPFLEKRKPQKDKSSKIIINNKMSWPVIEYHGLLKSKRTDLKLFVLVIDSKEIFVKLGQSVNGVRIERGDAKKIKLRYKGSLKTISIKNDKRVKS